MEGAQRGCREGTEGPWRGAEGAQRGARMGWLPLATINLVGDNRELEV